MQAQSKYPSGVALAGCCESRKQLASSFATNARLYAEAVAIMTSPLISPPNLAQLYAGSLRAQERSENASIAFEEHVKNHGC
jgi:hypothetical protein